MDGRQIPLHLVLVDRAVAVVVAVHPQTFVFGSLVIGLQGPGRRRDVIAPAFGRTAAQPHPERIRTSVVRVVVCRVGNVVRVFFECDRRFFLDHLRAPGREILFVHDVIHGLDRGLADRVDGVGLRALAIGAVRQIRKDVHDPRLLVDEFLPQAVHGRFRRIGRARLVIVFVDECREAHVVATVEQVVGAPASAGTVTLLAGLKDIHQLVDIQQFVRPVRHVSHIGVQRDRPRVDRIVARIGAEIGATVEVAAVLAVDPELYPLVVGRMFAGGAPREGGVDVPGHGLVHVALVETQGEHLVVRVQLLDLQRHHDIALGAGTLLVLLGLLARIDLDDDFVHRHDFHVIGIVGVAEQVVVVDAFHASEMDRIDHIGRYFHARRRVLVAYVTPQLDAGSGLRRIGIVAVGDLDSRAGRGLVLFLAQRILLLIGARRDGNLGPGRQDALQRIEGEGLAVLLEMSPLRIEALRGVGAQVGARSHHPRLAWNRHDAPVVGSEGDARSLGDAEADFGVDACQRHGSRDGTAGRDGDILGDARHQEVGAPFDELAPEVHHARIQRRTRGDAVEHLAGNVDDRIVRIGNGGHAFPRAARQAADGSGPARCAQAGDIVAAIDRPVRVEYEDVEVVDPLFVGIGRHGAGLHVVLRRGDAQRQRGKLAMRSGQFILRARRDGQTHPGYME